ncbi:uncharacterized protein LOC111251823 [Varroa destructor]|uniref:Uncharacterized protein n=1 Tax=Varroa destructor TaxID=109461 RepID=A0A7M7KEM0_VARDE|nr:uncharacterized protein LOC111251823 [Varroa destructor]
MSSSILASHNASALTALDKEQGEVCQGVIKKLFPAKRYGFVVLECIHHIGEAHFNYSDLLMDDRDKNALCVGWRLQFTVVSQDRPTAHCEYRAQAVRAFPVMVIQCEVYDASKEPLEFISSEIGNKRIFCYKKYFNGKVEGSTSRETCRAAISWNQLKAPQPLASHCSQDTPAVPNTPGQHTRTPHKTPERKTIRRDVSSLGFPHTLASTPASVKNSISNVHIDRTRLKGYQLSSGDLPSGRSLHTVLSGPRRPDDIGAPYSHSNPTSTPKAERNFQSWMITPGIDDVSTNTSVDALQREDQSAKHNVWFDLRTPQDVWNRRVVTTPRNLCEEFTACDNTLDSPLPTSKANFTGMDDACSRYRSQVISVSLADGLKQGIPTTCSASCDNMLLQQSSLDGISQYDTNAKNVDPVGSRRLFPSSLGTPQLNTLGFNVQHMHKNNLAFDSVLDPYQDFSTTRTPLTSYSVQVNALRPSEHALSKAQFDAMLGDFDAGSIATRGQTGQNH